MKAPFGILTKWIFGFSLSVFFAWAATGLFTDSYYPKAYSEEVGRNIPAPGSRFTHRSEGVATTTFGDFGIAGYGHAQAAAHTKIVIWGDSFIEAHQVPDSQKIHRLLTEQFRSENYAGLGTAVAVGKSWWSFADYLHLIPRYEKALGNCRLHVIHLHTLEDIYPDRYPGARTSLFLSDPELRFEYFDNELQEIEPPVRRKPLSDLIYACRLQFFLRLKKQLTDIDTFARLRFSLGNQSKLQGGGDGVQRDWDAFLNPDWIKGSPPEAAWRFAMASLKEATALPVVFVYAPVTPTLKKGATVTENPEREHLAAFERICGEFGFHFISMEEPFLRHWEEAGSFPHGFHSSRPWEGHYNRYGHRLVARSIANWLKENSHVVHPD